MMKKRMEYKRNAAKDLVRRVFCIFCLFLLLHALPISGQNVLVGRFSYLPLPLWLSLRQESCRSCTSTSLAGNWIKRMTEPRMKTFLTASCVCMVAREKGRDGNEHDEWQKDSYGSSEQPSYHLSSPRNVPVGGIAPS